MHSPVNANWEIGVAEEPVLEKAIANYCNTNAIITNATADPQAALDAHIDTLTSGNLAQLQALVRMYFKALTSARKRTRP